MADLATTLDGLSAVVTSTTGRSLVTVVALVSAVAVAWIVRRIEPWVEEQLQPVVGDLLTSGVVVGAVVAAVAITVGVWGFTQAVMEQLNALAPGSEAAPALVFSLAVLVGTHAFLSFLHRMFGRVLASSNAVTEHQREVTFRVAQVTLWSAALVVLLGIWQVDLSGLLIGAGFLGIVLGMAARQTLGAILAGFVLMFARPFEIGDWIQVGDDEGIVTDISIVNTRIQTFDGEYVMLPNDHVSSSTIVNRTRKGRLRIEVEVGVDYDTDLERASAVASEAMDGCGEILSVPTPQVVHKRFGDSSIVLGLRFWIDKPSARRKWRARTEVVDAVKTAFDREGITIPFPQRTLSPREAGADALPPEGFEQVDSPPAPDGGEE